MPAFSAVTLTNELESDVIFGPSTINPLTGVAEWRAGAGSYDSRSLLTYSMTLPKSNASRVRLKGKLAIPIMDSVDATKKVDELIATFELSLPKNAGMTPREDLRALFVSFLQSAVVTSGLKYFENVY